ncbi:MAG: outer membrane lipoprotein-sorting protein [Fibrobacterales bacterium]
MKQLIKNTVVALTFLTGSLFAESTLNVTDIITKANNTSYYAGKDGRAKVHMTIKDDQGRKRKRSFTILRKDIGETDGEQKFYVFFRRPSDIKNMAFLVYKHMERDDDRWLYLPSMDLVKRIAGSDKRTSFVGSSFFYEDVSGRGLTLDTHTLEKTTAKHYVVKNVPKDLGSVEFSEYTVWINKTNFVPEKIEYLDKKGVLYRSYRALKTKVVQGHPTVTMAVMKDHNTGVETLNKYTKVGYDIGIDESIFTERFLRKPPQKLLKF